MFELHLTIFTQAYLKQCSLRQMQPKTMKSFLKLRKKSNTYKTFLSNFIRASVGSTWYLGRLRTDDNQDSDGNQLFTASEEAFALLVVENSYDQWVDIYK